MDVSLEHGTLLFEACGTPWPEEGQVVTIAHPERPQGRAMETRRAVAREYAARATEAFVASKLPEVVDAASRTWFYQQTMDAIEATWGPPPSSPPPQLTLKLRVITVWSCPPEIAREVGRPERTGMSEAPPDATTFGSTVVCAVLARVEPTNWNVLSELFELEEIARLPVVQRAFLQQMSERARSPPPRAAAGKRTFADMTQKPSPA